MSVLLFLASVLVLLYINATATVSAIALAVLTVLGMYMDD